MVPADLLGIPLPPQLNDDGAFLIQLTSRILEMLQNDPRSLVAAMYRLDVGEAKVAKALEGKDRQKSARELAAAVLERERRRMNSRLKSKRDRLTE